MTRTTLHEKMRKMWDSVRTALIVFILTTAAAPAAAQNVVTDWAATAQTAIAVGRPPGSSLVLHALVQLAMYDTVIAIKGRYEPYAAEVNAPPGTDIRAAVATAAYRVLHERVPLQVAFLDAEYAAYLATIPDGQAKTDGLQVGEAVAAQLLALRATDGFDNVVPYVQPPPGPGVFEPVAPTTPVDVKLGQVTPYTFDDPTAFRPDGPAPLTSREYTENFIETRDYGRSDSTIRSPEQTDVVRFWAENTYVQWSRNLRTLAINDGLSIRETARLLAMAFTASADSAISCFEAKYFYLWWRPVHAIPRADTDGNPDTAPDPTWTALLTVNHPEYPSGHACVSTPITEVLAAYFGTDRFRGTLDSTTPGLTSPAHTYRRFSDIVHEINDARVWAGLHWRHSMKDGGELGRKVAAHVMHNFFRRAKRR